MSPPAEPILLRDGLVLGRHDEADVVLADPAVSRRHLALHAGDGEWIAEDLGSKSGSYLNGRLFLREPLTYGDLLGIGPFSFRFDGRRLRPAALSLGAGLCAIALKKSAGPTLILNDVSLAIAPGEFVGVIGPSGAGKSSLLDALCGLRPAQSGDVFVDGRRLAAHPELLRDEFGYVPQDDIVPLDLTVTQALAYSAELRLPRGTPAAVRRRAVRQTIAALGLAERADTRVGRLSGGQRKRVSVAAELLARPRLLFLDEPTSGLDPLAEGALMDLLRRLAANGCTVVCTTHVMENADLLDRVAILHAGRLAYCGPPADARTHFGVERLTHLYEHLEDTPPPPAVEIPRPSPPETLPPLRVRRAAALPVLLRREWAVLLADPKNLALALGQPVLIAGLVTWVSHDAALNLFFAYIATLWFGCGNAAQEIVKELPMYRRERLVGLGRHAYLLSKFLSLGRLTVAQSLLTYLLMWLLVPRTGTGIGGAAGWQIAGLVATSFAAVGIGLLISAAARSVLQAVMLVPIALIPQILFSGFTPPAGDFKPGPFAVSRVMPSAAVQSVMDVSLLWDRRISGAMRVDFPSAFTNLNRDRSLRNGQIFQDPRPGWRGLATLGAWIVGAYAAAWALLRRRERG